MKNIKQKNRFYLAVYLRYVDHNDLDDQSANMSDNEILEYLNHIDSDQYDSICEYFEEYGIETYMTTINR